MNLHASTAEPENSSKALSASQSSPRLRAKVMSSTHPSKPDLIIAPSPIPRWQRLIILILILSILLWVIAAWVAARMIASPARRGLQDYHLQILQAPAAHGMEITAFSLPDGTPCLLCRPDPSATLGQRGILLRQQLSARQVQLPPPGSEAGATLVLLHGRRGRKEDNLPIAERFCAAGFRCILPDLPAHGEHPASIATFGLTEASLPANALHHAARTFGFPPQPAGLWGISMGGSVAMYAAAASGPDTWSSMVIVASFDALLPVIQRQSQRWLGPSLGSFFTATIGAFFNHRTDHSLSHIRPADLATQIHLPTLIVHGDDDPLIPLDAGIRLYEPLPSPHKRFVHVGAGTHGNVLITPQPLYADMSEWFHTHLSNP